MGQTKQAKSYSEAQQRLIILFLSTTRYPLRNKVIFLLSCHAGLRAKEVALLEWRHVLNNEGTDIGERLTIHNSISKGKNGGRKIEMTGDLIMVLKEHYRDQNPKPRHNNRIVLNQQNLDMTGAGICALFWRWFKTMRMDGYSSHSGRRTFITTCARRVSQHGCSLYDVQRMAGHANLNTTQGYIESNEEGRKKLMKSFKSIL